MLIVFSIACKGFLCFAKVTELDNDDFVDVDENDCGNAIKEDVEGSTVFTNGVAVRAVEIVLVVVYSLR